MLPVHANGEEHPGALTSVVHDIEHLRGSMRNAQCILIHVVGSLRCGWYVEGIDRGTAHAVIEAGSADRARMLRQRRRDKFCWG